MDLMHQRFELSDPPPLLLLGQGNLSDSFYVHRSCLNTLLGLIEPSADLHLVLRSLHPNYANG